MVLLLRATDLKPHTRWCCCMHAQKEGSDEGRRRAENGRRESGDGHKGWTPAPSEASGATIKAPAGKGEGGGSQHEKGGEQRPNTAHQEVRPLFTRL